MSKDDQQRATPASDEKMAEHVVLSGEAEGAEFQVVLPKGRATPVIRISVNGSVVVMSARQWYDAARTPRSESRELVALRDRLRVAMNFIEEWAQWWSYALAVDDSKSMSEEEKFAAEQKAESFGQRGARMVIENRHFLNTQEPK